MLWRREGDEANRDEDDGKKDEYWNDLKSWERERD